MSFLPSAVRRVLGFFDLELEDLAGAAAFFCGAAALAGAWPFAPDFAGACFAGAVFSSAFTGFSGAALVGLAGAAFTGSAFFAATFADSGSRPIRLRIYEDFKHTAAVARQDTDVGRGTQGSVRQ